jgi:hypothetical protein
MKFYSLANRRTKCQSTNSATDASPPSYPGHRWAGTLVQYIIPLDKSVATHKMGMPSALYAVLSSTWGKLIGLVSMPFMTERLRKLGRPPRYYDTR